MEQFFVEPNIPETIDGSRDDKFQINTNGTVTYWPWADLALGNPVELQKSDLDELVAASKKSGALSGQNVEKILKRFPATVPQTSLESYVNYFLEIKPIVLSQAAGTIYR